MTHVFPAAEVSKGHLEKVLYTAKTHSEGGRDGGTSRSDDGRLDLQFTIPGKPGSGTNPEQLFAAGWSTCFIGAIKRVAGSKKVSLPTDVVVGKSLDDPMPKTKSVDAVSGDDMILDIGPKTAQAYAAELAKAGTIVWNGPVGVFEKEPYAQGTQTLARAVAEAKGFSIAGGGDTVAAINKYGIADRIDYVSTAGGAFLEFLEGKQLPAVAALEDRANG